MKKPLFLFLLFSFFAASCSDDTVPVSDLTFSYSELSLLKGEKFTLSVFMQPLDATNRNITLDSSNPEVAYISKSAYSCHDYSPEPDKWELTCQCFVIGLAEGDALLTATSDDGGIVATCRIRVGLPTTFKYENGQSSVDLGLSVRWAYYDLGTINPMKYGDYYAWGEIEPKSKYHPDNYKFYNAETRGYTKYCINDYRGRDLIDGLTTLELSDDAVHQQYGGSWRMPTAEEWEELQQCCSWTRMTSESTVDSVDGYLVRGKNGSYIFLPDDPDPYDRKFRSSYYWTSSLDTERAKVIDNGSARVGFNSDSSSKIFTSSDFRYYGHRIRGVTN